MSRRESYRGALIGAGGVARLGHLPAFAMTDRLSLATFVDDAGEPGEPPGLRRLLSREQLAASGPLDFIDICTPTATHVELVTWGLANGYHVLCEKPVAVTRREAERIAKAARRAGRIVMPCHQYRFNPAWLKLRSWLDSGAIGRWHLAEFQVWRPHADRGAEPAGTPWRGRHALSLGGVLLDHGTHLVYLLLDVAGPPVHVHAWTGRLRHEDYDVEDTAQLLFEYPGRAATVLLTWAGTRRESRIRFVGESGTIDWTGGMLRLESDRASEELDFRFALDKAAYRHWFAALLDRFADAMDAADGTPALEEIAEVAQILERAYAAARSSRPGSKRHLSSNVKPLP